MAAISQLPNWYENPYGYSVQPYNHYAPVSRGGYSQQYHYNSYPHHHEIEKAPEKKEYDLPTWLLSLPITLIVVVILEKLVGSWLPLFPQDSTLIRILTALTVILDFIDRFVVHEVPDHGHHRIGWIERSAIG